MKRALAALVAVMALAGCRPDATQAKPKPELYVLTSLPLVFDEGFGLGPATAPAATFLRSRYTLKSIDLPSQLPRGALLLAAQPRALPAEELVVLDAWVRGGGRLLLLADPMLRWPSAKPFGDLLRPPMQYPDTGLLLHWGLRLDAPDPSFFDKNGLYPGFDIEGFSVANSDPGALNPVKQKGCVVKADGALAECVIGKGRAIIIADADFLNVGDGEVSPGNQDSLPFLESRLDWLDRRK